MFTNAITYLSLDGPEMAVTLPLDLRTQGFANPEGVAIAPNGERAWVAHAGADIVSVIDLKALVGGCSRSHSRRGPFRRCVGTERVCRR